jgi:F-type H+-transporting ATPase subunit delta
MPKRVSGRRYAEAIFELALQEDQVEQWATELELVGQVLQDEDFSGFLKHADVPVDQKIKSIDSVLAQVHPLVRNMAKLLVSKGLVDLAGELQEAYAGLWDKHAGRQRVEVTSAVVLDQQEVDRIAQFVSGLIDKEVVVSTQVDESILGGIIIQIGDQLLDGSTRSKLEGLRSRLHSDIIPAR